LSEIVGRYIHGRATVAQLQMNHLDLISIRRLSVGLGLLWSSHEL
jgi:hypothetical protein